MLFVMVGCVAFLKGMDDLKFGMVMLIGGAEFLKPITICEPYFHSQVKGHIVAQVNIVQALASAAFKIE